MVPFIKWVGGKRQLLPIIVERLPKRFNTYYEPFVGGGALFFALAPNKAVISDTNKELVNAYLALRDSPTRLKEYLLLLEYAHSAGTENFFKKMANLDRDSNSLRKLEINKISFELKAARFIYLNKSAFNGIYRVNKRGFFNTPSAKKKEVKTFDEAIINQSSAFLQKADIKIEESDYEEVLTKARHGDFVYLDPPYDYEEGQRGFDSYQRKSFNKQSQKRLALVCKVLNKRGVKFMLSNHNTKLINKLYQGFFIEVVKVRRLIGGKGSLRSFVEEVLITNYESGK